MKTGIIKAIYDDGEFDTQYGHLYAYKMLIQFDGEQNQTEGGINSKSHPYPGGNGDEITVEIQNTQHGVKFKRVNPQQQGGGGQNSGGRGDDVEGKCRTLIIEAGIASGQLKCQTFSEVIMWTDFAITGNVPPEPQKRQGTAVDGEGVPF